MDLRPTVGWQDSNVCLALCLVLLTSKLFIQQLTLNLLAPTTVGARINP